MSIDARLGIGARPLKQLVHTDLTCKHVVHPVRCQALWCCLVFSPSSWCMHHVALPGGICARLAATTLSRSMRYTGGMILRLISFHRWAPTL